MTHCRTGCGAEINYKRVHFSSPVDWYDIPMEGDVIHDCPKLKPSTNDGANDVLKELQDMHVTLNDYCLRSIVEDFSSPILDFIDLPQKLKMHSKEFLQRNSQPSSKIGNLGPPGYMPREDFDKLSESEKEEYKEFYGSEPPNKTPGERQAEFWQYINQAFDFLQRCADRFPAPFYTDSGNTIDQYIYLEYSQLELFRIFLESKEQYADAMNCHIIQGAVDIAKGKMDADAFTEVTGRLQKKLDAERLANEWTLEDTLAEKKRLMSLGIDEEEAESEAEMERVTHEYEEEGEREYPASQMIWALKQYRKELDRLKEKIKQDDALEHDREQIEVDDIVDTEQTLDDMKKLHSQEYFGPFHKGLRNLILFIYEEEEIWERWPKIYDYCERQRNGLKKKLYKMKYKDNLLGHATLGQLVHIFENEETKNRSKGYEDGSGIAIPGRMVEYDELLLHFREILLHRNMIDHDERNELPKERKALLVPLIFIVNEFFEQQKHLKQKK